MELDNWWLSGRTRYNILTSSPILSSHRYTYIVVRRRGRIAVRTSLSPPTSAKTTVQTNASSHQKEDRVPHQPNQDFGHSLLNHLPPLSIVQSNHGQKSQSSHKQAARGKPAISSKLLKKQSFPNRALQPDKRARRSRFPLYVIRKPNRDVGAEAGCLKDRLFPARVVHVQGGMGGHITTCVFGHSVPPHRYRYRFLG